MSVQVLLSTYNGVAYVGELLDSILSQRIADLDLLIRDDGSTDDTVPLLQRYASLRPGITVEAGSHLGITGSFFALFERASSDVALVALCDQDDVWCPDKLAWATDRLSRAPAEVPTLYCSRLQIVDEDLRTLKRSALPRKGLAFRNALVECAAWGCTMVMNQAARRLLVAYEPRRAYSHDWWIYLVVSAFGRVIYDDRAAILYRRHPGNSSEFTPRLLDSWRVAARRFREIGGMRKVTEQAEEFHRAFGARLPADEREVLARFLSRRRGLLDRLRYALEPEVYRQSMADHLLLKFLIAADRL